MLQTALQAEIVGQFLKWDGTGFRRILHHPFTQS